MGLGSGARSLGFLATALPSETQPYFSGLDFPRFSCLGWGWKGVGSLE